jgi:hypothetical protein
MTVTVIIADNNLHKTRNSIRSSKTRSSNTRSEKARSSNTGNSIDTGRASTIGVDGADFSQLGGDANFSQLGGGADFSLNVTDVIVIVTVRTFPDLEAVPTFQL